MTKRKNQPLPYCGIQEQSSVSIKSFTIGSSQTLHLRQSLIRHRWESNPRNLVLQTSPLATQALCQKGGQNNRNPHHALTQRPRGSNPVRHLDGALHWRKGRDSNTHDRKTSLGLANLHFTIRSPFLEILDDESSDELQLESSMLIPPFGFRVNWVDRRDLHSLRRFHKPKCLLITPLTTYLWYWWVMLVSRQSVLLCYYYASRVTAYRRDHHPDLYVGVVVSLNYNIVVKYSFS